MRYLLPAFGPGCDTKSWYVLPRKESRIGTEKLLREWWPMNDEPLIRLRPRKSKHWPNDNPRKYAGILRSMLRIVQISKRGQKTRGTHSAGGSVRAYRTFNQRVAVRVSYSANKNPGQWKAHGSYVARESATQGGKAVEAGFNATATPKHRSNTRQMAECRRRTALQNHRISRVWRPLEPPSVCSRAGAPNGT